MPKLNTTTEMVEICCGNCGCYYAIQKVMHDMAVEEGGFWHCPNGHRRGYREGRREREAIRLERDRLKQQVAELDDALRLANQKTVRMVAAARGEVTKLKKRAHAGVCPCCNRTFVNMARHMQQKHPTFDPSTADFESKH